MMTEQTIRIHSFHNLIAISFTHSDQLYLTKEDADSFRRELSRFVLALNDGRYTSTRIIEEGKARNESDGKSIS